MANRAVALAFAVAFLVVFLLTPPGKVALEVLGFVPQTAWGWAVGFAALLGFVLASRSALRRSSSR
jgi:sugar phosphate permease